jgi:hypothetical protein
MSSRSPAICDRNHSLIELDSAPSLPRLTSLERVMYSVPERDISPLVDEFLYSGLPLLQRHSIEEFGAQLISHSLIHSTCVNAVTTRLQAAVKTISQTILGLLASTASGTLDDSRIQSTLRHGSFQIDLDTRRCFWQGIGAQYTPHWDTLVRNTISHAGLFRCEPLNELCLETFRRRLAMRFVDFPGFTLKTPGYSRDFMSLTWSNRLQGE